MNDRPPEVSGYRTLLWGRFPKDGFQHRKPKDGDSIRVPRPHGQADNDRLVIIMAKKDEKILRVVRIGNSIGVILPKKEYEFRDIEPKDWVKIEFKGVVR